MTGDTVEGLRPSWARRLNNHIKLNIINVHVGAAKRRVGGRCKCRNQKINF